MTNAIDAYSRDAVHRTAELSWQLEKDWLLIHVSDQAGGIKPELATSIFDSFVSSKTSQGRGLGLGLSIVKHYVTQDFGGSINVKSYKNGCRFSVSMPTVNKA